MKRASVRRVGADLLIILIIMILSSPAAFAQPLEGNGEPICYIYNVSGKFHWVVIVYENDSLVTGFLFRGVIAVHLLKPNATLSLAGHNFTGPGLYYLNITGMKERWLDGRLYYGGRAVLIKIRILGVREERAVEEALEKIPYVEIPIWRYLRIKVSWLIAGMVSIGFAALLCFNNRYKEFLRRLKSRFYPDVVHF